MTLAFQWYSSCFNTPERGVFARSGRQGLLPAQALHVEPCGHAIASSGYNWVALMPTAVATQTPLDDSPILAVLPSCLSSSIHSPRHKAPAPPTPNGPDSPVDAPITASDAPSPSRSYTSDEAWLRAQTDSCRLDAMWMASDLNSIQDLVQDQEEHLSPASPLTAMPPSGLIRSICFVGEHMQSAFCNPLVMWRRCQYDISCSQQDTNAPRAASCDMCTLQASAIFCMQTDGRPPAVLQCWHMYAKQLQLVPEYCTSCQHTFNAHKAA